MINQYNWGKVSYTEHYKKDAPNVFTNVVCFGGLMTANKEGLEFLEIFDTRHKKTKEYRNWFLQYIADMLALEDVTIAKQSFKFKAYPQMYKNMLVLSLVRLLWERFGGSHNTDSRNHELLEQLLNGKCKYRNKLARFCYFYSKMETIKYFNAVHIWKPRETKIRYTKEFVNANIENVNSFFYGKY